MPIVRSSAEIARQQARWIASMEPWLGLGYRARRLGAWLAGCASRGEVRLARQGAEILGIIVVRPSFLLGDFIALLAVRPQAARRGVGKALVEDAAARTFRHRRWLFSSSDSANRTAAHFYRKLGFVRVGRLPDLVRAGRTETLWRRVRPRS